MIMKIFDKVSKIFFAFICFIVILGMIFLSVRNYITPRVAYTSLLNSEKIKNTYYYNGIVSSKPSLAIEIKAAEDITVSEINIKSDQIVEKGVNLFSLDVKSVISDKLEAQDAFNKKLKIANEEVDKLVKALGKKIKKDISSVDDVNPDTYMEVFAPSSGKIKNLAVKSGQKVLSKEISDIIDDSMLKVNFKMTPNEYPMISVGDDIFLTFSGYEGYYDAKVVSINPNAVPDKDKISYLYNGVIEVKNPGLVSPGVTAGVCMKNGDQVGSTLANTAYVESYVEQSPVETDYFSVPGMDIYAKNVYVIEGEYVEKGQKIADVGGDDLSESLKADINIINSKIKAVEEMKADAQDFYTDVIYSNKNHELMMDRYGTCSIPQKIYVEYVIDRPQARKDDVLLRYYVYKNDIFTIKVNTDYETYSKIKKASDKIYYGKDNKDMSTMAELEEIKEFSKNLELFYKYNEVDIGKYRLGDNILFSFTSEEKYENVVPKTAVIPIGKMEINSPVYVYTINTEDSILGKIEVLNEKRAIIKAVGDEKVSIEFTEDFFTGFGKETIIVNYINSALKDGMRVKTK